MLENPGSEKNPLLPEFLDFFCKTTVVNNLLVNIHLEEIDRSATAAADLRDVGAGVEGNRVTTLPAPEFSNKLGYRTLIHKRRLFFYRTGQGYTFSKVSQVIKTKEMQLGCPRKCVFDFRRNTEFFQKHTEFRGIPRNSAKFRGIFCSKISRNSAEFLKYLHTEFLPQGTYDPDSRFQIPKNTVINTYPE